MFRSVLSYRLLKSATKTQRWKAIGLADWIAVGRWWLLKVPIAPLPAVYFDFSCWLSED